LKAARIPLLGVALACALVAAPALADPVDACLRAADEGQVLRDQGKLLTARERLLTCSRTPCPGMLRADCAGWLADVEARLPSVVLGAQDAAGRDVVDVEVTLDGAPLGAGLSGRALPLDPGPHRFVFTRPGAPPLEQTVVLREGERRRLVSARFPAPGAQGAPGAPPPSRLTGSVAAAIALGGVALAGGGVFVGLAVSAQRDFDHLKLTCAPRCPEAAVAPVRTREIAANVALGVGIGAAVAAAVVLVARPGEPSGRAAWLTVVPAPGGVGLAARF
jgi:hypothetical protein